MTERPTSAGVVATGRWNGPVTESLADVLERVLDTGIVIVGDVVISLLDIEVLTLKLRLFIASAETAREMGLDWWSGDPFFNSSARRLEEENRQLRGRLATFEDGGAVEAGPGAEDSTPAETPSEEMRNDQHVEQTRTRPQ